MYKMFLMVKLVQAIHGSCDIWGGDITTLGTFWVFV